MGTKVEATDVDDITLTYSLSGASDFVIEDTGQIQVAPGVTLDREHTSSYNATVTADDRSNASDSITVTINVSNVNEAPTAVNDTAMTREDQSVRIDVLANDTDPDTEKANLMVSVRTQPLNGRARVESDRTITYTPNANFAGPNSFTYRLTDGQFTDNGSVSVTVVAVNDAPTAVNDTAMTREDQSVRIDVLANDTDPDTEKANLMVSVRTQPLNGRARVESDRTITYTPNANFAGPNSFTYRLTDGQFTDNGSVSVTVVAVNDAPTFLPTTAARSVPEDAEGGDSVGPPVTATDVDEGDTLFYSLSGTDASSFEIDSDGGQITVADWNDLRYHHAGHLHGHGHG